MKVSVFILLAVILSGCRAEYVDAPFWKMHTIEDQLEGADGVDLFDIDGDGDLDTVSGWEEAGDVLVHENPGAALVRKPWTRTSVSGGLPVPKIEDARFADFDDDGQLDAVVSATENRSEQVGIHWLLRRDNPYKKESWHGRAIAPQLQYLFVKVAIGQIDGRGALDLVVGSKSDNKPAQLVWYQAPADPGPETTADWRGRAIADINWTDSLEIVDINGDGANDILLGYWQHLAWYENPGHPDGDSAVWKPHLISDTTKSYFARCDAANAPASALRIIVGADISAAVPGATVAWLVSKELDANNVWNGRWLQQRITSPDPIPRDPEQHEYWVKSIACGNIDENPLPDIIMTISGYGHGVFALMNLADTRAEQSLRLRPLSSAAYNSRKGIKHDDVRLADVDLDGDLDIVTTEENGSRDSWWSTRGLGLIWYENPGRP